MNFAAKQKKKFIYVYSANTKKEKNCREGISFADCQEIMTKYSNKFAPFGWGSNTSPI